MMKKMSSSLKYGVGFNDFSCRMIRLDAHILNAHILDAHILDAKFIAWINPRQHVIHLREKY